MILICMPLSGSLMKPVQAIPMPPHAVLKSFEAFRFWSDEEITTTLIRDLSLPNKATADAAHIALAIVNGMDFLLTWNCTHIANAVFRPKFEAVCRSFKYKMPVICTPEELMR